MLYNPSDGPAPGGSGSAAAVGIVMQPIAWAIPACDDAACIGREVQMYGR